MSISNKIRAAMKLRGLKYRDIGAALGISAQAVSNKMHRDSFTASDLVKIAAALGCTLSLNLPDGGQIILTEDDPDGSH